MNETRTSAARDQGEHSGDVFQRCRDLAQYLEASGLKGAGQSAFKLQRMVTKAPTGMDAVTGMKLMVDAARDYHKVREEETTKRVEIQARTEVALAELDALRGVITGYMERNFDQRQEQFSRLFDQLDAAQSAGRTDQMAVVLDGILALAKTSPFMSLAEARRRMRDEDHTVEL